MRHAAVAAVTTIVIVGGAWAGPVFHVDDDAAPGGDGASWATAYRFLQDGLLAAIGSGGEIRVAQGTYTPDRSEATPDGTGDRAATFVIAVGLAVRGGYAGVGAPDPDARDVALYETVLSGDLAGDDLPGFVNTAENSHHVARVNFGAPLLEGFTITGGNADGDPDSGGGLRNVAGPTIRLCTFLANRAAGPGGAVRSSGTGTIVLEECTFAGNAAQAGGALSAVDVFPVLADCVFTGNVAAGDGGAVASAGSVSAADCTFTGNTAGGAGSAMRAGLEGGLTTLEGCLFIGGATDTVVLDGFGSRSLTGCVFLAGGGAAVSVVGSSSLDVANCVFSGNAGPGIVAPSDWTEIVNCTLVGNEAGVVAGTGPLKATSCIFRGNTAGSLTGDLADTAVYFSDIEGGWTGIGRGNFDADPLFVDPDGADNVPGTADDDLHLAAGSPCIDAGDPGAAGGTDVDGDDRVQVCRVDVGADETPFAGADCNGNGEPDGCELAGGADDCDGNGVLDECDPDLNGNGAVDACEPDCNGNGVPDDIDVSTGTSVDCDLDGLPDECGLDCNGNGVADVCDVDDGTSPDCNANGIPDECDVSGVVFTAASPVFSPVEGGVEHGVTFSSLPAAVGDVTFTFLTSAEMDDLGAINVTFDHVFDEWYGGNEFCPTVPTVNVIVLPMNGFNIAIADGEFRVDLQPNIWVDEECFLQPSFTSFTVEYPVHGPLPDCNGNGLTDDCESAGDCDGNGTPDFCDPDCNANGVADACDIAGGMSTDWDGSGVPDECECLANLNVTDEVVGILDFLILLAHWGPCEPGCNGDIDRDGQVGILDMLFLLASWGPCP